MRTLPTAWLPLWLVVACGANDRSPPPHPTTRPTAAPPPVQMAGPEPPPPHASSPAPPPPVTVAAPKPPAPPPPEPEPALSEAELQKFRKQKAQRVCIPIAGPNSPRVIASLGDGTFVYERPDGTRFRGKGNRCRCLPPWAAIDTPIGARPVVSLAVGDTVWTEDAGGRRVARPILRTSRVAVPPEHVLLSITLADGRSLRASPLHPLPSGAPLSSRPDRIDGAVVVRITSIPYAGTHTHDVLPAGDTGLYWADGVKLASTLR